MSKKFTVLKIAGVKGGMLSVDLIAHEKVGVEINVLLAPDDAIKEGLIITGDLAEGKKYSVKLKDGEATVTAIKGYTAGKVVNATGGNGCSQSKVTMMDNM
jgi:hypothetical protein